MPEHRTHDSKVGIGMPVYNGEKYLEESIRANLAQTFDDISLYIADNASTDRTPDICRDYAASDKRVVYIRNPQNIGAARNYRRCFEPAGSPYFRWSNADDVPDPTLVEKCVRVLDDHPDAVLVYGQTRIIDADGRVLRLYDDNLNLPQASPVARFRAGMSQIGMNNVMYGLMRRQALAQTSLIGGYPGADINLVVELALYGTFREIPERLFSRRMHPQAMSWDPGDGESQKNFWDPSRQRPLMRTWQSLLGHNRAVLRAPIGVSQKAALLYFLLKKASWERRAMTAELAHMIRFGIIRRA